MKTPLLLLRRAADHKNAGERPVPMREQLNAAVRLSSCRLKTGKAFRTSLAGRTRVEKHTASPCAPQYFPSRKNLSCPDTFRQTRAGQARCASLSLRGGQGSLRQSFHSISGLPPEGEERYASVNSHSPAHGRHSQAADNFLAKSICIKRK